MTTLQNGSRGPDVENLQIALQARGFSPQGVDGRFGPHTRAALTAYQRANGLPQTGVADDAVIAYIAAHPAPAPETLPAATYRGCDADTSFVPYLPTLVAEGFQFLMCYLKIVTLDQVKAHSDAGLATGLIFETTAQRALGGEAAGTIDGQRTLHQLGTLQVPSTVRVFPTVDTPVSDIDQRNAVCDYHAAFREQVAPVTPEIGSYAEGLLCDDLYARKIIRDRWLAGAMGWPGSRRDDRWEMIQGWPISVKTGARDWEGLHWPVISHLEYDPDLARTIEFAYKL